MSKLISLKLDVSKIDKRKLFKGKKGTYLDLTIAVNDEKDQYDNDGFSLAKPNERRKAI